jgi:hypothetical protein
MSKAKTKTTAPAVIKYAKTGGEAFIFVNGPEPIEACHLADTANAAIYCGTVNGTVTLYYEHNNETQNDLYYGFYFYNSGTKPVRFKLLNNGASYGWTTNCETWKRYYEFSGKGKAVVIDGNTGSWLFYTKARGDKDIPSSDGETRGGPRSHSFTFSEKNNKISTSTFDGIWKADIKGELEIRVLAFTDIAAFDPRKTEPIDCQTHEGHTGHSAHAAAVAGHFAWTIYDSTPDGRLPVTVNGAKNDFWVTNCTDLRDEVLKNDNLPLTVFYKQNPYTLTYDRIDPRTGKIWSWANWGVIYKNTFTVKNEGKKARTLRYFIMSTPEANRYMGTYSPLNTPAYKELPFSDINNWLSGDRQVTEAVVKPGETAVIPVEYVLGGQSCGYVAQYITVEQHEK